MIGREGGEEGDRERGMTILVAAACIYTFFLIRTLFIRTSRLELPKK